MLRALLLTLAIEVPLYTAALVALNLAKPGKSLALAAAVNLITHPALWLFLERHPQHLWPAEVTATATEAAVLMITIKANKSVLAVIAVGTNAASLLIGLTVA